MTTVELTLPQKLRAGEPGWQSETDVVVIGSGIAGLTTAVRASRIGRVTVVTKDVLSAGSTSWAMGGVAAAIGRVAGRARLEASGGLRLNGARAAADTGVDYLAVGALTHSVHALDIALDLR